MMYNKILKKVIFLILLILMISSCVSRKNIVYFQELKKPSETIQFNQKNNLKIKPDDLLTIRVSAPEQEAAMPFNLTKSEGSLQMAANVELETYMVSNEGTIEFPVLGAIKVQGLSNFELAEKLKQMVSEYVQDPIVNVRILNFRISVLGEVRGPGTFVVEDDHITLPQALGMAGDLTIQGKRNKILVMREINGEKVSSYLNIGDENVVNSPFYHLMQNDVVYVEPITARRQAASSLGVASSYLSIASVLISLVILLTN